MITGARLLQSCPGSMSSGQLDMSSQGAVSSQRGSMRDYVMI